MASPSSSKGLKSAGPSSSKPKTLAFPTSLTAKNAALSYKVQDNEEWIPLPCVRKTEKINVGPVVFQGSISITQKTGGNRCTFQLQKLDYSPEPFAIVNEDSKNYLMGVFRCLNTPQCTFESDKEGQDGISKAREYPLAKLSSTFFSVRVLLPIDIEKWTKVGGVIASNERVLRGQLNELCSGHSLANPQSTWAKILGTDMRALLAESEEQEKQLGLFRGCRIATSPGKGDRSVIVQVFPGELSKDRKLEAKDYDFDNKKVGQSYIIKAPGLFKADEETMRKHKIFDKAITDSWEMNIIKDTRGYEAPVVGIIRNSFDDISEFLGEETNVSLEPIFHDVLGERGRSTIHSFEDAVNEYEAQVKGYFANPRYPPQIPAFQLFGMEKCNHEDNKLIEPLDIVIPEALKTKLNESQLAAVEKLLSHKVSIIWGAPGTGKSLVLAEALTYLLETTSEKIVACAVANVAVNAIYRKCVEAYRKLHPKADIPFVRLYSTSQIQSQYAAGELTTLDDPNHIECLRFRLAQQDQDRFRSWLQARDELRAFGILKHEDHFKAYNSQGDLLSRTILENHTRVVFCTVTACQTPALYKTDKVDKSIIWAFPATSIFLDESGTATRPLMLIPPMTFVMTVKRFVLAGDPYQLPALLLSTFARNSWPKSLLLALINLQWPCSFLTTQYRMPEALYEHLCAVIYNGKGMIIRHAKKMENPSNYGLKLRGLMPLRFDVGQETFRLTSYVNFFDAANGVQKTIEGGSSWNEQEVDIIDALVLALLRAGAPADSIAICTGYTRQKKLLMDRAKQNGWSNIKMIMTIDSSQGHEYAIVIVSLVTTRGQAGFMGSRYRANVGTSRQTEGLYFVGKKDYWFTRGGGVGFKYMHSILSHINKRSSAWSRPSFIQSGTLALTYVS